jgi:hypothetical protein
MGKLMKIKDRKQSKELAAVIAQGHKLVATQQTQEATEFLGQAVKQFPNDPEIRILYCVNSVG